MSAGAMELAMPEIMAATICALVSGESGSSAIKAEQGADEKGRGNRLTTFATRLLGNTIGTGN